ncbi:hypothetical protein HMPREF0063_10977 [Aeromicrobium marinum DSM 15272]|uniref:HTH cro/C1-type domain-containing protein n=2 Tax=Aeromicrobium marinum TaxID=219314 RepID=E2SAI7_9ACTN|nr:hypothetical protein HMPREF0063_10977 [Aeromicrobium marinum DSM 15272]
MTRSQLAERSELSYPYVSQIETGLRKPSRKAAAKIAEALGMSPMELEAAIPRDEDDPEEVLQAQRFSDNLIDGVRMGGVASSLSAEVSGAPPRRSRLSTREDLICQLVDLVEEFDADHRLDVLAEVQKRAMERIMSERQQRRP